MAVRKINWLQRVFDTYRETLRSLAPYRKYGLRAQDMITLEDPDVTDAIKTYLPEEEYQMRITRLRKAFDLAKEHRVLPRDQWTKPDEDINYLAPYIEKARQARLERQKWDE